MQKPEWYVWRENFNTKKIEKYNVFDHWSFWSDTVDSYKKNKKNKEAFVSKLRSHAMYYFWSKCEWEVEIHPWISQHTHPLKIDVYNQLCLNWDVFVDYVWSKMTARKKPERKKNGVTSSTANVEKVSDLQQQSTPVCKEPW